MSMPIIPEWGWGIIAGVGASGVGAVITGFIQARLRRAERKETRRRDAAHLALEFIKLRPEFSPEDLVRYHRPSTPEGWSQEFLGFYRQLLKSGYLEDDLEEKS